MFRKQDPNSLTNYFSLFAGKDQIGNLIAEYQVINYDDVQVQDISSVSKSANRRFMLHCTQRIIIFNKDGLVINPDTTTHAYNNYPVLVNTNLNIIAPGSIVQLLDYSPQTVNTQVQNSGTLTDSNGQTNTTSRSNTVGSSTSQTNSFGASVSVGLTEMSDSASMNYEQSNTSSKDRSFTIGADSSASKSQDTSNASSMSIKDWGAYALADPYSQDPNWVFAQEYPWSVIECRKTNGNLNPDNQSQVELIVPTNTQERLYDQVSLYPPSQLSMFGINFVMKGLWIVTLADNIADTATINHTVDYFSASHAVITNQNDNSLHIYMDKEAATITTDNSQSISTGINLPLMALDVLGAANKPSIIGFIPSKFTVKPSPVTNGVANAFKIISTSNTLMVNDTTDYTKYKDEGFGFSASQTSMTSALTANCTSLQMTAYFKVVDTVNDYTLFLKHWKAGSGDVKLTLVINGDDQNPIVKYVDAIEAEGGEHNLLAVALRDQNYASIDYHDYLQLGLNSIQIIIEPVDVTQAVNSSYALRAISIERG